MTRFLLQDSHHPQRKIIVVNRSEARHNQLLKLVPSDSVGVCAHKRLWLRFGLTEPPRIACTWSQPTGLVRSDRFDIEGRGECA
jgi:hypothetical protein